MGTAPILTETIDTYLLLRAFVDELARCGLAGACTSPGSRSTPLVLTLARQPGLQTWSHVDERVAGFFALGVAKQSGRPAAVACTSGTAAAHYLPAVIEAHEARIPLVMLTADRPPELREVGAGQTIDQLKLYGDAAKWFFEVGTHRATPERLRWMRQLAFRAYETAVSGRPGAVHLNFALREPLVLDAPLPPADDEPLPRARRGRRRPPRSSSRPASARSSWPGATSATTASPTALAAAAAALGAPLLADPLSGARRGPAAVAHYDDLLRDEAFAAAHRPDTVIRVGDLPTCKPLRQWLAGLDGARQIAFDPEGAWQDPAAVVGEVLDADPAAWARSIAGPPRRERVARRLAPRRRRRRRGDRRRAGRRDLRARRGPRARRAAERGHRLHRVLDAGARRRELLAGARRAAARAGPPRRQRHRRHAGRGLRRRRRGRARRRPPRRRRPRPRPRRAAERLAPEARAHRRPRRQRRRRDLRLPPRRLADRRLRGARGHADGPGGRARRRPLRPGVRARATRSARSARPPGPCCTSAPTAPRTSLCTAACTRPSPSGSVASFERP